MARGNDRRDARGHNPPQVMAPANKRLETKAWARARVLDALCNLRQAAVALEACEEREHADTVNAGAMQARALAVIIREELHQSGWVDEPNPPKRKSPR